MARELKWFAVEAIRIQGESEKAFRTEQGWMPKTMAVTEDNEYIVRATDWLIKEKGLVAKEEVAPEIKVQIVDDEKAIVETNNREYRRKLYGRKYGKLRGIKFFTINSRVYKFTVAKIEDGIAKDVKFIGMDDGNISATINRLANGESTKNIKIEDVLEQEEEQTEEIIPEPEEEKEEDGEVKHKKYRTIKACIENNVPVFLVGPAGRGKNHVLQGIAKDLGLDFYFTNSVQQEFKVTGFIDAGGKFHETEFYKAFSNGGLFFLDEMDASIPEVLVLLNAAIANGYFEFPNGKVFAHPNFRVVAAGNTVGNGADEIYTGRLVLDGATLDRFVVIEFDYDRNIELALAKGNTALVNFVNELRTECKKQGIRATFSYRIIIAVTKLEKVLPLQEVIEIAVVKGMDKDTLRTLRNYSENRYWQALQRVAAA
jgi:cobaltochelatase CobS